MITTMLFKRVWIILMLSKGSAMKFRRGSMIRFSAINDFTGDPMKLVGKVVGYAKEIKKIDPENFGGLEDDEEIYLVMRKDNYGNWLRHVVNPEEVLEKV